MAESADDDGTPWDIQPGQQVVCIYDTWVYAFQNGEPIVIPAGRDLPVIGRIYTITDTFVDDSIPHLQPAQVSVRLAECLPEDFFPASAFRPVKKTTIDVFEQLLAPAPSAPVKVLEDA